LVQRRSLAPRAQQLIERLGRSGGTCSRISSLCGRGRYLLDVDGEAVGGVLLLLLRKC